MLSNLTPSPGNFLLVLFRHVTKDSHFGACGKFQSCCSCSKPQIHRRDLVVTIAAERKIALLGALDNIGLDSVKALGVFAGIVVASPSTENPNCAFLLLLRLIEIFVPLWYFSRAQAHAGCRLLCQDSGFGADP